VSLPVAPRRRCSVQGEQAPLRAENSGPVFCVRLPGSLSSSATSRVVRRRTSRAARTRSPPLSFEKTKPSLLPRPAPGAMAPERLRDRGELLAHCRSGWQNPVRLHGLGRSERADEAGSRLRHPPCRAAVFLVAVEPLDEFGRDRRDVLADAVAPLPRAGPQPDRTPARTGAQATSSAARRCCGRLSVMGGSPRGGWAGRLE